MLSQHSAALKTPDASDPAVHILDAALRALDVEFQRQRTGVHLLSPNKATVESLLGALDNVWGVQQSIRRHLLEEPNTLTTVRLFERLMGETDGLRRRLWPTHGYACEALTRVMDILQQARESLPKPV